MIFVVNQEPEIDEDEESESRYFVENLKAFTSPKQPSLFGVTSLALTLLNSIWFTIWFAARKAAWWESSIWFFLLYVGAALLALRGIRSPVGMIALVTVMVPLIFLSLLLLA